MPSKNPLQALIPPILFDLYKSQSSKSVRWKGNYANWSTAIADSKGYDQASILNKIKNALLKVKAGQAAYERDGVLFDEKSYSWELIANLLKVAGEAKNELCVLDFGGSLGSSYYQNKDYFQHINKLTWCIIEQNEFVKCGKENFEDTILKFYYTIEECLKEQKPQILLLLSVIQYLENPYQWIDQFKATKMPYIYIDRTAFITGNEDRLCIQKVPKSINEASYPAYFFNEEKFVNTFSPDYRLCFSSENDVTNNILIGTKKAYWKNFLFKRK